MHAPALTKFLLSLVCLSLLVACADSANQNEAAPNSTQTDSETDSTGASSTSPDPVPDPSPANNSSPAPECKVKSDCDDLEYCVLGQCIRAGKKKTSAEECSVNSDCADANPPEICLHGECIISGGGGKASDNSSSENPNPVDKNNPGSTVPTTTPTTPVKTPIVDSIPGLPGSSLPGSGGNPNVAQPFIFPVSTPAPSSNPPPSSTPSLGTHGSLCTYSASTGCVASSAGQKYINQDVKIFCVDEIVAGNKLECHSYCLDEKAANYLEPCSESQVKTFVEAEQEAYYQKSYQLCKKLSAYNPQSIWDTESLCMPTPLGFGVFSKNDSLDCVLNWKAKCEARCDIEITSEISSNEICSANDYN